MLDQQDEDDFQKHTPVKAVIDWISDLEPSSILEVGCSSGRAYRALKNREFSERYTGCDVSESVIAKNRDLCPEATWVTSQVYQLPFESGMFDVCFSLYVVEHLVYPEKALTEMLRVTKEGGYTLLLFPDFQETGMFASQQAGFSFGRTSEKLKQGKLLDALVTFYDNRFRFPWLLNRLKTDMQGFFVNLQPACLYYPHLARPDYDAVYIASKAEVIDWAEKQDHEVSLPKGERGMFRDHAFVAIGKGSSVE